MEEIRKFKAPSGKTYVMAAWPALIALSRGIKILNQIGPLTMPFVSLVNEEGAFKDDPSVIQNFISPELWRSLDANVLIEIIKELCDGIMLESTNKKIDVENHFNDCQEDLFPVIKESAEYQLSPFLKAGPLKDLKLKKKAVPAGQ